MHVPRSGSIATRMDHVREVMMMMQDPLTRAPSLMPCECILASEVRVCIIMSSWVTEWANPQTIYIYISGSVFWNEGNIIFCTGHIIDGQNGLTTQIKIVFNYCFLRWCRLSIDNSTYAPTSEHRGAKYKNLTRDCYNWLAKNQGLTKVNQITIAFNCIIFFVMM